MPPLARPTRPRHHPTWRVRAGAHRKHQGADRGGGRHGAEAEPDEGAGPAQAPRDAHHDGEHSDPGGDGQALPQRGPAHLAPREHGRHRHQEQQGQAGGDGHRVEEGRADRHLLLGDRLVEQRVDGSEEDHQGEADEHHVVEKERALPPERCVDASGERSRSPRQAISPKPTMITAKKKPMRIGPSDDSENEVHRGDHARAGEERPEDGQGERGDRE